MKNVNELRILTIRDADFIVRDDRADGLEEYKALNDTALAEIRNIAEDATTMSQVESKIEEKVGGLNLDETYEPIGSEVRARNYVDQQLTEANLAQYTTEQEVKTIVDTIIKTATSKETLDSLVELVEYIDTHSGDAINMATAISVLENKTRVIEEKPAYDITSTQIDDWNNEIGVRALLKTKLDETKFNEYTVLHADDYTNKQIDDAISSEAIRVDNNYEQKGVASAIIDNLKLEETYEPIGAETRAITAAKMNIDTQISNLAGEGNTSTVKKNADDIATLFKQRSWRSF